MQKVRRWIGIAGSWRKTNNQVETDVRNTVINLVKQGFGIVTGGALGVDYIVTDELLKLNPEADLIKIFLPVTLDKYIAHYKNRAKECVINDNQFNNLSNQLNKIKSINPQAIIENKVNTEVNKETYYERNTKIVNQSDELIAFHVNESKGVQDSIDKAKEKNIPVKIYKYTID